MEVTLTHKVDDLRKIYQCESRTATEDKRVNHIAILVLASNSDEAIAKFKEYIFQERPSLDPGKIEYRIAVVYVVT